MSGQKRLDPTTYAQIVFCKNREIYGPAMVCAVYVKRNVRTVKCIV